MDKLRCLICQEIDGDGSGFEQKNYRLLVEQKKNIIFQTDSFVLLPSIGPLNESHILIVPKLHIKSFSTLSEQAELELSEIKQKIRAHGLLNGDKKFIFFEHGTGDNGDTSGGCVDHAHVHAIWDHSKVFDVFVKEMRLVKIPEQIPFKLLADVKNGYVYAENHNGVQFIRNNPDVPSQFFRKLYASVDTSIEVWNWRSFFNFKGIEKVILYYQKFS